MCSELIAFLHNQSAKEGLNLGRAVFRCVCQEKAVPVAVSP